MNSYDLSLEFRNLLNELIESEEEITEEQLQRLAALSEEVDSKIDRTLCYRFDLYSHAVACKQESIRLKELSDQRIRECERLDKLVHLLMETKGINSLKTITHPVSRVKNPTQIIYIDDQIPPEYKKGTVTLPLDILPDEFLESAKISIAKAEIKEKLKSGEKIPGAFEQDEESRTYSLRIKGQPKL